MAFDTQCTARFYTHTHPDTTPTHYPYHAPTAQTDYYAFIKRPVALSDIATSIDSGRYTLLDMQRDIRRMIANAKRYNKPEAVVYQDSLELEVSVGWLQ